MSDVKDLSELFKDLITTRGLSVDKLALSTNIPRRFINLILDGDYRDLPSKPYVRGYLIKIASVLEMDPEIFLESYSASTELSSSGKKDSLPTNRFALKPLNKNRGWAIVITILVILAGIIVFRFNDIIGTPYITVDVPGMTSNNPLHVSGKIKSGDQLTVNGEVIYPTNDGLFTTDVSLDQGPNTIEFDIKRFLGRETKVMKQVIYQPTQPINQ